MDIGDKLLNKMLLPTLVEAGKVLIEMEWMANHMDSMGRRCPYCSALESGGAHNCRLSKIIQQLKRFKDVL